MTLDGTVIKGVIVLSDGTQLPEGTQVRVELAGEAEPARSPLGKANIEFLSSLMQQLVQLCNEAEKDDYGILRASKHAFDTSCALLIDAAIVSAGEARQIPYGCVGTDSEGGVRIEWARPTSNVRLVIPPSAEEEGYVYHEEGTNYGTESATPEALARWLRIIKD